MMTSYSYFEFLCWNDFNEQLSVAKIGSRSGHRCVARGGAGGGPEPPQNLADQVTLFEPGGQNLPLTLLPAPPDSNIYLHLCSRNLFWYYVLKEVVYIGCVTCDASKHIGTVKLGDSHLFQKRLILRNSTNHGLRTPGEEIVFTARPKINSHFQIFRYSLRHILPATSAKIFRFI